MNATLHPFFGWLLRSSWRGAVLAILVLLAQFCLRKRLDGRWRHLLWLLVLARLAIPVSPPSPASLFNYIRYTPSATAAQTIATPDFASSVPIPDQPIQIEPREASPQIDSPVVPAPTVQVISFANVRTPSWPEILATIWSIGATGLGLRVIVQNRMFRRGLRRGTAPNDPRILDVFENCKASMRVANPVCLIETDLVESPALYGLFHSQLLLPPRLAERFTAAELRHIFLHELAHVRRRDMATQWLVMCFQILHWFNPILWFGFRRMAADRELACDELAISVAGEQEGPAYGQTIIKLLEASSQSSPLPGLVGMLEDKSQIFQRVSMIARFKKHSRWSLIGAAAAIVLALATFTGAQTEKALENSRPNLIGTVRMSDGSPANATVLIYTARPRVGTSPYCPSCYPDCNKSAKVGAQGRFEIDSLDPQLLFRLLVVGEGCRPAFVTNVDPAKDPITVTLDRQNLADVPPDCMVRGRITDAKGNPVKHATVERRMVLLEDGSEIGMRTNVDPLAVSDERGEFVLTSRQPIAKLNLVVEASGFARRSFIDVPGGGQSRDFQLTEGATFKGRVVLDGKPLANVSVGVVSEDRSADNFAGNYKVGTDNTGQFVFLNLPPNVRYQVYGLMETLGDRGVTKVSIIDVGGDGSVTDAGNLEVVPAHRISGRVVLSDGNPVPPKTKLSAGRTGAWDSVSVDLDKDGSFSIGGIPTGTITLSVQLPGYNISAKNESLEELNPYHLIGIVSHDISGMVVLMDKGPMPESYFDSMANGADLPENRPLAGIEHADDHSRQRMISGRVTDKETGRQIAGFRITPGRATDFQGINWNPLRAIDGADGAYVIYLSKESRQAVLKIDAPGYMPMASPEMLPGQTNFDFALTKGDGPSGVVLLPNGAPAAGAQVTLVCQADPSGMGGVQLRAGGELQTFGRSQVPLTADATGHFSFQPEFGMNSVAASSPFGFKRVAIDSLKTNAQITLEPWGSIKGVLRRGGMPSTNETLDLTFGGPAKANGLQLFIQAVTDGNGAFAFDHAPPGQCEILALNPTEEMPQRLDTIKQIHVEPGKVADATIDAAVKTVIDASHFKNWQRRFNEKPSKNLAGFVLLPDGKPAANARIGFADQQHELHIGDGELIVGPLNPNTALTEANGAFTVPWPDEAIALYVASEEGVARLKTVGLTNGMQLTLEKWARVEGTMRLNRQPAAGKEIRLHRIDNKGRDWQAFRVDTTVEPNGHFLFAHVLPGECGLGRWMDVGNNTRSIGDDLKFTLTPGESTNILWGGDGRPVTGTLELTNAKDLPDDASFIVSIHPPYPVQTNASKLKYSRQDYTAVRHFEAHVATDNTFQVDDVPPGHYTVTITGRARRSDSASFHMNIVMANFDAKDIAVPALTNPEKCEPYDLGKIQASLQFQSMDRMLAGSNSPVLKAGETAPDFTTQTLDGKPLRLADYRGKFVLLDFRYMFPGGEMEGVKSVNDTFGKDARFVTVTLCENADDDYVKELKSRDSAHWMMGNLDVSTIPKGYGLVGARFPAIMLVGPDGKVIASELHGEAIYASVAKALTKK